MKPLCSFQSIVEFLQHFNYIPVPSKIFFDGESRKKVGDEGKTIEEYSLFKDGIEPEWGDPANVTGGEWFIRHALDKHVLDGYWENLLLAVVGETMEDDLRKHAGKSREEWKPVINGVRVVDKCRGNFAQVKIEMWVATREPALKDHLKVLMEKYMTDGVVGPSGGKGNNNKQGPRYEWKSHNA